MRAARVVLSMRRPTQPSSAGTRVSEPRIIISTPIDEATAMPWTKLRPIRNRPISEMITVMPGEQHGSAAGVDRLDDRLLDAQPESQAPLGSG